MPRWGRGIAPAGSGLFGLAEMPGWGRGIAPAGSGLFGFRQITGCGRGLPGLGGICGDCVDARFLRNNGHHRGKPDLVEPIQGLDRFAGLGLREVGGVLDDCFLWLDAHHEPPWPCRFAAGWRFYAERAFLRRRGRRGGHFRTTAANHFDRRARSVAGGRKRIGYRSASDFQAVARRASSSETRPRAAARSAHSTRSGRIFWRNSSTLGRRNSSSSSSSSARTTW